MEQEELSRLRGEIDRIDGQLLALYTERMEAVERIAALKEERGLPVRDEAREAQLLARVREQAGPRAEGAEKLFTLLLSLSRALQERRRAET